MRGLLFSGEAPGQGGYLVAWSPDAPPVGQCRPRLEQLDLHDWSRTRTHVCQPEVERLSWRTIDAGGYCPAWYDAPDQQHSEAAWLAGVDLQLQRGVLRPSYREGLLFLLVGVIRLQLDRQLRDLLARADHFLDYRLGFLGPDGSVLSEARGHFRFLEKHEAMVVPQ